MLKKINKKDLLFSGNIEDDRTNTFLNLDDYDWMNYVLKTRFRTEKQGTMEVSFEYMGMTISVMKVVQTLNDKETTYDYAYDSELFIKYIKKYLRKHIAQWADKYAFNGEDIVIAFYNEVIKKGYLTDGKHLTKKVEENEDKN